MEDDISQYTPLVVQLSCESEFNSLSLQEKTYAHYLSQASINGALITLMQTSPESPLIFALLHKLLLAESVADIKDKAISVGFTENDFTAFLVYVCLIFENCGNYQGFKITPDLSKEKFELIVNESKAYKEDSSVKILWYKIKDPLYSYNEKVSNIGFGNHGITTYFSANCTKDDADLVNEFMNTKGLESWNTRCFKTDIDGQNYKCIYEIRIASTETSDDPKITLPEEAFKNSLFKITRGDYNLLLLPVVENLKKAKKYASNETEVHMISKYITHFETGSLEEHKDASRFWIENKSPAVETYIGFVENYKDPAGQRGEFEGFVGIVNREASTKFSTLVDHAETLLSKLPWGRDFENDHFLTPHFKSLNVLTFATSIIPFGKNIPNYDDVRQSIGFKNLSFKNVIIATYELDDNNPFLLDKDKKLLHKYYIPCFELQTGLHEFLGHGSGKLFKKLNDGTFNFDIEKVKNPFTGEAITNYYINDETYTSVFGSLATVFEECRAEAVGLYLSLDKEVTRIFGHEGSEADDIIYVSWLSLFWLSSTKEIKLYDPSVKKWQQVHCQARFVLLRVCLEAGEDFIKFTKSECGEYRLTVDRNKIHTVGKKAIGNFLKKLQYFKSTADVEAAKEIIDKYSELSPPWVEWRKLCFTHRTRGKFFLQTNTTIDETGNVQLKTYESTYEGIIQSWIDRFPRANISDKLVELWEKDQHFFKPRPI